MALARRPFVNRDTFVAAASCYEALYADEQGLVPATFNVHSWLWDGDGDGDGDGVGDDDGGGVGDEGWRLDGYGDGDSELEMVMGTAMMVKLTRILIGFRLSI